jgi:hypothetical protein
VLALRETGLWMRGQINMNAPKIALCVITGRERATIERFLDSWRGTFDLLSIVEAVGTKEPDGTIEAATEWCRVNAVPIICGAYNNDPRKPWPHVDSFAAARQLAFDQAADCADWLFWADVDDLFQGEPETLRQHCLLDADIYRFPYEVPDAGKQIMRERLVRASLWSRCKWVGPVHEVVGKHNEVVMTDSRAVSWVHAPTEAKEKDPQRNLRILKSALDDAPGNLFYVAQEYMAANNIPLMRRYAKLFLEMPGGDPAMQYQAHLWLCKSADMQAEASEHALAAFWLFPYAEAIAALTKCAMQEDDPKKAYYFARMLNNCQVPEEPIWCHEPRWYGWARNDIYRRALRLKGCPWPMNERLAYIEATEPGPAVQVRDLWLALAEDKNTLEIGFIAKNDKCRHWLRQFVLWESPPLGGYQIDPKITPEKGWDKKAFKL